MNATCTSCPVIWALTVTVASGVTRAQRPDDDRHVGLGSGGDADRRGLPLGSKAAAAAGLWRCAGMMGRDVPAGAHDNGDPHPNTQ